MARLDGFDASQVEPARPFDPIPAGRYVAVIEDSQMKETQGGTGEFLELKFRICDGKFTNRLVWARLTLKNPNPIAEQIAKAELSAICRAVGVMAPGDSTELHDLPLMIHVRLKKREDNGELVNEISGYSSATEVASNGPAVPGGIPPWQSASPTSGAPKPDYVFPARKRRKKPTA